MLRCLHDRSVVYTNLQDLPHGAISLSWAELLVTGPHCGETASSQLGTSG